MTKKELVEELNKYPDDYEIMAVDDDGSFYITHLSSSRSSKIVYLGGAGYNEHNR